MPSDVLQALLGVLAGGARGYAGTKEQLRKEKAATEESKSERDLRMLLLNTELVAREKLAGKQMMNERELANIKLAADREQWQAEIDTRKELAKKADATERSKIAAEITMFQEKIAQADRELKVNEALGKGKLGLERRSLDIEEAYRLGTGPKGTGAPGSRGSAAELKYSTDVMRREASVKMLASLAGTEGFGGILGTGKDALDKQKSLLGLINTMTEQWFPYPQQSAPPKSFPSHRIGPGIQGLDIENMPLPETPISAYEGNTPFEERTTESMLNFFQPNPYSGPLVTQPEFIRSRRKSIGTLK
jgi:hypothetical protein